MRGRRAQSGTVAARIGGTAGSGGTTRRPFRAGNFASAAFADAASLMAKMSLPGAASVAVAAASGQTDLGHLLVAFGAGAFGAYIGGEAFADTDIDMLSMIPKGVLQSTLGAEFGDAFAPETIGWAYAGSTAVASAAWTAWGGLLSSLQRGIPVYDA